MADPKIYIRRSATPNKVPTDSQLALGELAINTYDGKLYFEQDQGGVGVGTTVIAVNPWNVGVGSLAYDINFTSGNVGVGTTNPTTKLQVNGVLGFGTFVVSPFNPQIRTNIKIGDNETGANLTSGYDNIFMGVGAGNSTTSGSYNNFLGSYAGYYNTVGGQNNFFGDNAGFYNTTGDRNNFIGSGAGSYNTTGDRNNFLGYYAGLSNSTGNHNTFLGSHTGISTSASRKVILGSGYDYSNLFDSPDTTKDTQFAVGIRTDANPSKYWLVGNENFNIGIGTTNPTSKLTVGGDVSISGVVTASSFVGNLVGIASTANTVRVTDSADTGSYYFPLISQSTTTGNRQLYVDGGIAYSAADNKLDVLGLRVNSLAQFLDDVELYFGSSNDAWFNYNGTGNYLELQLESAATDFRITDNGTERFRFVKSTGNLGIGTTNPTEKLSVTGNILINDTTTQGSFKATTATTSPVGIHSILSTSTYLSVEYTIQATEGSNFHATKILALHDGSSAYLTEYGTIYNNASVSGFNVDVSGGNIRLIATPASASSTNYTINFIATKI